MKQIPAQAGSQKYEIMVGGSLAQLPKAMTGLAPKNARVALITDASIARTYGSILRTALSKEGYSVFMTRVPSGERFKTLAQAAKLYQFCARARLERQSWLIALGGGVVGDLAGFVAATYLRGISLVQVPTTLLAQVDASIGGKTAVDIPEGKNLVGAFYQPRLVWIAPETLQTLSLRHQRNGMAEIIKYGAIRDLSLFEWLEEKMDVLLRGPSDTLTSVIAQCATLKADVVARDPLETKGLRSLLNFGHSVGHAIEAATDYQGYLHGEAISIGMVVASFIAQQLGLLDPFAGIRLENLIAKAGLPIRVRRPISRKKILEYLSRDKKVKDGTVRFVLLEGLGKAKAGYNVALPLLEKGLSIAGL